jgi:hypothetical protein
MTHELQVPYQQVERVYWSVSPSAILGVVDQVRTTLVELVAQVRADTGSSADAPSAEAVTNAVNVAVHGRRSRVTVNTAQTAGDGAATATTAPAGASPPWWRTTKALWGLLVGAATIAAAVFAWLQLT